MKNMKIMAVLAVLLAAALFVGAASATGTIFVNEMVDEKLLTQINGTTTGPVTLYKLSGDQNPVILDQITLKAGNRILASQIGSNTGAWYNTTTPSTANLTNIYYPEITLSAELATLMVAGDGTYDLKGDSINGKTINTNTPIAFIIDAPRVGGVNVTDGVTMTGETLKDYNLSQVKLVFTTPAGGKTDVFGYNASVQNPTQKDAGNFAAINLTGVQTKSDVAVKAGSGATAGTWTVYAEFVEPQSFKNYADKSNSVTFTLQSTSLVITAAKDSVIRNNPFTVSISGDSNTKYGVYLEGIDKNEVNPYITLGQNGLQAYVTEKINNYDTVANSTSQQYTAAIFQTDASGQRTIQYDTTGKTEDKTYTVKVIAITNFQKAESDIEVKQGDNFTIEAGADYDTVKVKVEKGGMTITASGDGQYYIGQEIALSGTNTDSDHVYLFITGPNLLNDGVILKQVGARKVTDEDAETIAARKATENDAVSVKTDDTWEYKWDTSGSKLDTGSYTIYATSILTNGKSSSKSGNAVKLSDSEYATVSVSLKQPFLSAVPSGTVVAKGDKIYLRGTAEGDPSSLMLYIFGPNKFVRETITVEDNGSYEKELTIGDEWASNQYFVVIEHPMYNGKIDVQYNDTKGELYINNVDSENKQSSFNVNDLQSSNAADALTKMIDNPNIDDVYTKLTFTVVPAVITIKHPGDQAAGSTFTISGTTNLAVGDQIIVEVQSSSFNAVDKSSSSITDGTSLTTKVVAGEGSENTWSVEVDTTNWKLDEYTVRAEGIEVDVSTTTNFNLVEKVVTPTPTATSTGVTPTTTATATATATPSTPGFGAFVALAGLGAVALLVLRRN